MRMAVAFYVRRISTPVVHPEFPPLLGTSTEAYEREAASAQRWRPLKERELRVG